MYFKNLNQYNTTTHVGNQVELSAVDSLFVLQFIDNKYTNQRITNTRINE